ncbi:MAG: restriction endonuclease subunit S [Burkholderiaceae bacterium]|nr:restriction endonuclease subunit S [Burkholderiaceae bacterium]
MAIDAVSKVLGLVAGVRSGYPFRGSIEESDEGEVLAVQMKDVNVDGGVSWTDAIRTSLQGRKKPDWLKAGDILFVSKGARFYAVCIDEPPSPAVCSPHFFHIQVAPNAPLIPAFLAWQMNQSPFQHQLQQAAEGSSQLSIRRPVLESLTLSVPPLPDQHRIVALSELARQERRALYQLIQNRERQLQAIAEDLTQSAQTSL